jgi:hypothetical protein
MAPQIAIVKDVVTITRADATCSAATGLCTLAVEARSTDQSAAAPALTAAGFGPLTAGVLTPSPSVAVLPAAVTVTSESGGSDSEPVRVIHAP